MNWNLYEHETMKEYREKHRDWIWNRGDTHVILSVPGAPDAFKTPVEPGNSFSPGPGSYGVSTWVYTGGKLYAPEEMPLAVLTWRFEEGFLPVLHADWQAGEIAVHSELFADGDNGENTYQDYLSVRLHNTSAEKQAVKFYLALRSFGAAGGKLTELSYADNRIYINGSAQAVSETAADGFGAVSYGESQSDISVYLRRGQLPPADSVKDESTWASGALEYRMELEAGESRVLDFCFVPHAGHWMRTWQPEVLPPLDLAAKKAAFLEKWRGMFGFRVSLPDRRFAEALYSQLTHLYMFTVADAVRITPISYPIWWLRDGAYILNALDKGGFHDFADRACRAVAGRDAFGGFGAEGDGPSQGIWLLSEHFMITGDMEYLRQVYPDIRRKAELLMQMRRTDKPMRAFNEFVIPKCMLDPTNDLICLAAEDGLIMGRMDHHFPVYIVNGLAYLAFRRAAVCARAMGLDGNVYENEAKGLKDAMMRRYGADFGANERDVCSALWPAGWADAEDGVILRAFDDFWNDVRCPDGAYRAEKDWTYFEAGQAHNYLLLGQRERAWASIAHFLSDHTAPGLYTYSETVDGNTALLWPRTRGWDDEQFVTPHGWTAAEVFLLLRDSLVREDGDTLVIGMGVPEDWKDQAFSVENLPTYFGRVSFWYDPATRELRVQGAEQAKAVRHAFAFDAVIR